MGKRRKVEDKNSGPLQTVEFKNWQMLQQEVDRKKQNKGDDLYTHT